MKTVPSSSGIPVVILLLFVAGTSIRANQSSVTTAKKTSPSNGPTMDFRAFVRKYDLSRLWTTTKSSEIFGFIGAGYQRLQIHFLSVRKDRKDAAVYLLEGKTLVRNRVRQFTGTIVVESVVEFPAQEDCERDIKGLVEGNVTSRYLFKENPKQDATGVFAGKLKTSFYKDRHGVIHYDDISNCSDSYSNNEFVGTWKGYRGTKAKKCDWGDYRAPDSGDLDIGAGEFSPNEKYIKNGWETFVAEQKKMEWTEGKVKENKWWK